MGAQTVAGTGFAQAHHAAELAGFRLWDGGILRSGVQPQLRGLLRPEGFPAVPGCGQQVPDLQTAAGDLQEGEPGALAIPGDFVYPGAEGLRIRFSRIIPGQEIQQVPDALVPKGGAEEAGKDPPLPDQQLLPVRRDAPFPKEKIQGGLVAEGDRLNRDGGC